MPIDRSKYPANWNEISRRIRQERAGNKCEWCEVNNGQRRFSLKKRRFYPVVLTVAHLDHDTANNDESNLAALCQRCHLRHDAKQHAETRHRNRTARQRHLFE